MELIVKRPEGLYCPPGDFYIDPSRGVDRAIITHAHGDHARTGSKHYLATQSGEHVLRTRLGDIDLQTLAYGEQITINNVNVSLHPAGHVLGSAQVRVEYRGEIWVASGDYKFAPDPTCAPFEPVRCHTFITESTFGLPIYRWPESQTVAREIAEWWQENASAGRASVLFCYAFGKAQRLLAMLAEHFGVNETNANELAAPSTLAMLENATTHRLLPGPIYCHGAVKALNDAYRVSGVFLPPTQHVVPREIKTKKTKVKNASACGLIDQPAVSQYENMASIAENERENNSSEKVSKADQKFGNALVIAPPSAAGTPWLRRFGDYSDAFASGWMTVRGARRRRGVDRGFVLSDHADWPSLVAAISATEANRVIVTHGQGTPLVRWLREHHIDADTFSMHYDEQADD